ISKLFGSSRVQTAETHAQKPVLDAEREAQTKVQQSLIEVKQEIGAMRREAEEDIRSRREEIKRQEDRLARKDDSVEQKQAELTRRDQELRKRDADLERIRGQLEKAAERQQRELESVARMTSQEAREALTSVNLIIDDTPEAVVLSCFDPVRRETARLTLEKLVSDGRIHPARIEEMYDRSTREVEEQIRRAGEEALADVDIADVHPEM